MTWQRFALVDCAADPQLHPTLLHHAQSENAQHRSLFARQPEAAHAAAAPWLLEMPTGHALGQWLANLQHRGHVPCVTWLASEVLFDPLFDHLEAQLDLALPDGALSLMRYYDPRAWLRYQAVLTPKQTLALMGPILEWQVSVRGQVWTVARADLERLIQEQEARAEADA